MNDSEHITNERVKTVVGALLLLWLVLVLILGVDDAFSRGPGALPLAILAGVLTPILVFLIAFWTVGPFRDFLMSIDLPVVAGIQAWSSQDWGSLPSMPMAYCRAYLPGQPDSVTWQSVLLLPW